MLFYHVLGIFQALDNIINYVNKIDLIIGTVRVLMNPINFMCLYLAYKKPE